MIAPAPTKKDKAVENLEELIASNLDDVVGRPGNFFLNIEHQQSSQFEDDDLAPR